MRPFQAELRVQHNDLLIMDYIPGVPLAIQTGRHLDYDTYIDTFDADVIEEMIRALGTLQLQLRRANNTGLLHNDPMPPNIIFCMNQKKIEAKLVDFEIAQNSRKSNPEYVDDTARELYRDRNVPINSRTSAPLANLDMHLINQSDELLKFIKSTKDARDDSFLDALSVGASFIGGFSINLGKAVRSFRRR